MLKKSKLLSLLMAVVMLVSFMFTGQIPANALEITTDNSLMYQQYVKEFLEVYEGITPVFTGYRTLLDVETDLPVAYCFEFNNGYIIVSINSMTVYESSLSSASPYANITYDTPVYYNGAIEYYVKSNNIYFHTLSRNIETNEYEYTISENEITSTMSGDAEITHEQKINKIQGIKQTNQSNSATVIGERQLNGSLTTAWVNGYCGPTSAHCMLRYLGFTDRSVSTHDMIMLISEYTGRAVSLNSLRNGMNNYLRDHGYSATVYSCNYSIERVVNEIDSNQPLTISRMSGSVGHVMTAHGYRIVRNENTAQYVYTIYVNESYGVNGVQLWYDNYNTPHNFVDHVYY